MNASSSSELTHFYSIPIVQLTLNLSWKHENVCIGILRHTFMLRNDKVLKDENKIALRYISLRYYLSCKIRWLLHLSEQRIIFLHKIFQKHFASFSPLKFSNALKAFYSIVAIEWKTRSISDLGDYKQFYNLVNFCW